ncbi:unnamed protein product [Peniophora sp. CBMAI 1063]|nr:unnamed protein product [Peniophora sp. CBMAI 1063]
MSFAPQRPHRIIHRLAVSTIGQPLWMYASDQQLVKSILDVLEGLMRLEDLGIVRHGIDPGNIFLAGRVCDGPYTYVIDLDHTESGSRVPAPAHQPGNVAESLAYALSYAMLRKCLVLALKGDKDGRYPESKNAAAFEHLMESYTSIFGPTDDACFRNSHFSKFIWIYATRTNPKVEAWMWDHGPGAPLIGVFVELYEAQSTSRVQSMMASSKQRRSRPSTERVLEVAPWIDFETLKALLQNALEEETSNPSERIHT